MTEALIIVSIGLAGSGLLCVWLWARQAGLRAERDRLAGDLATVAAQKDALTAELGDLKTQIAVAANTNEQLQKTYQTLQQQIQQQAENTFKALAGDALKQSGEQFLQLAAAKLKTDQVEAEKQLALRKKEIESLVSPIRETLDKYNLSLQGIEKGRIDAYSTLRAQVGQMVTDQQRLQKETGNLVKALHRSDVRGRWGEVQLRRVAELAGMIPNCDFFEQQTQQGDGGALRPDLIVRLPSNRTIVVDAKTPIDAFLNSLDCESEEQRQALMEKHALQIESKVRDLSGKRYWDQFDRAPDFVVLFIPGESFLSAALQVRPELIEKAMERNVVIATPSTLIALLKAVALGWREQQMAEGAQQISDLGRELHDRLCVAMEHVQTLGRSLESAVKNYNQFVNSLESRVVVTARKFEELGAKSAKSLPADLPTVDVMPRQVRESQK